MLISVALLVSLSQTILYAANTPADTIYPFVHNFVEDYYQYLDIVRQGYDGWWGATSRLTTEALPRFPVSLFLLSLGHAGRIFHLSVPVMYTLGRAGGAVALLALTYQLIRIVFSQSALRRLGAFCIVIVSTYGWGWGTLGPVSAPLPHAWTELDPIFRWSFIPHHLASKVFMLAAFLLLIRPPSIFHSSFLILFTILMGLANPVVYVTFIPVVFLYAIVMLNKPLAYRIACLTAVMVAGLMLYYHRYLQLNIFPWTSYRLWEQTIRYSVSPWEYAVSFGPTLPLFLLSLPALWHMGMAGRLLTAWAASSWLMMYIVGPFLPVTIERYLGGYQFIPVGIVAAVWLFRLNAPRFVRLGITAALLGYFAVGIAASLREHMGYVAANRDNPQVYIPNGLMTALGYLEKNGSPEDVVLAPYDISTMIPGLTGKRVVAGHTMFTKDVAVKRAAINEFFQTSDVDTARRMLNGYRISYVLVPSSRDMAWSRPILVPAYRTNAYVVYTTY